MSLRDLPLHYVDERENTGRAWLHDETRGTHVKITSFLNHQPEHPDAASAGYLGMLNLSAEGLTQRQAAALATVLQRFARTGSILPRGSCP